MLGFERLELGLGQRGSRNSVDGTGWGYDAMIGRAEAMTLCLERLELWGVGPAARRMDMVLLALLAPQLSPELRDSWLGGSRSSAGATMLRLEKAGL